MAEKVDLQKSNKYLYITGAVVAIIIIGLITNGFGLLNKTNPVTGNQQYVPLTVSSSPVLGSPDAPVTIYEFSDFSCPFCGAAAGHNQDVINQLSRGSPSWQPAVPNIIEEYVKTGKVKFVFKYFPGHGTGKAAHQVAYAMAEQNLFEEFHDAAFANANDVGSLSKMKKLAETLGADMNKLNSDLDSNSFYKSQLDEDYAMGVSQRVTGTPTFIVNGKVVSGAQPFSVFKNIIDAELK